MLRTYFEQTFYDMPVEIAQKYAEGIRVAILSGKDFEGEKRKGFFLSRNRGFEDKLYVGNIHRIENHLYWNDEELADDDQIVNVVVVDGPVTRDGDGCSYGSKDHRDQILYANTIPQVVGHIFILNTPGGAASARIDYEQAFADCREKGKSTVAWVDGMCCSAGQLIASLCDRTVVMNGRNTMGCIGTMCAFWAVANGTVDRDGYRYIELVSVTSPEKNAEYREAADGDTKKLQAELDKLGEEFRETVRQNRPMVKEEHLKGKTFDAQDVMGALVDEVGDYNRAIECVFELADKTLAPAREAVAVEEPGEQSGEKPEGGQKDMATLSEQQKAAVATSQGAMMKVDDGHVSTSVQTMFGPEEVEIATPKKQQDMTEEEKKAQEAAAAEAENQEPAQEPVEEPAEEPAAEPTQEEAEPAAEPAGEPAAEPAQEPVEEPAAEPAAEPSGEPEGEPAAAGEETEEPAAEPAAEPAQEPASQEPAEAAQAEIGKIQETLQNAEQMIADKDKEIAGLKADMEARQSSIEQLQADVDASRKSIEEANAAIEAKDKSIAEKDALIEKLTKQVADLKAEVRELAEKPAPMTTAAAGVPAGNGTGEAPKANLQRIRPGMSYEEIRGAIK